MTQYQNLYQILGLTNTHSLTATELKAAYHRTLLLHHPDKSKKSPINSQQTIDAIKSAYATLSNPLTRASYDQRLLLTSQRNNAAGRALTGEEIIDLDELSYDEELGVYHRACRCGDVRGFTVTEEDLEREADAGNGEVLVQCGGCSLWLRVGFSVIDDDGSGEGNGVGKEGFEL